MRESPFPAYLAKRGPVESVWFAHDDYEGQLVGRCVDQLGAAWQARLKGIDRSLPSHCRTMIVALALEMPADAGSEVMNHAK
jgi:hypothetical protein